MRCAGVSRGLLDGSRVDYTAASVKQPFPEDDKMGQDLIAIVHARAKDLESLLLVCIAEFS